MKEARIFSIMQYNMRKDKDGTMAEFLRDEEVLGTDVIAVQEPWGNKYCATTHHQYYYCPQLPLAKLLYHRSTIINLLESINFFFYLSVLI